MNHQEPSLREFVPQHISATPMIAGFEAAPETAQARVIRDVAGQLAPYQTIDGVRMPFSSHLAAAQR